MFVVSDSTERPLPGRQRLSREFIARHRRLRIIEALAQEVSIKGYRSLTVAAVARRAVVARKTFYDNFSSKEGCFLAAQQHATAAALRQGVEAAGVVDRWPQQVEVGLAAFLRYVVEHPDLACPAIVEARAAGPSSVRYQEESLQAFASLLKPGRDVSPYGSELPETLEEALTGGIFWILYQRLLLSELEQVEDLHSELVEFALTPYIGRNQKTGPLASPIPGRLDRYRRFS